VFDRKKTHVTSFGDLPADRLCKPDRFHMLLGFAYLAIRQNWRL